MQTTGQRAPSPQRQPPVAAPTDAVADAPLAAPVIAPQVQAAPAPLRRGWRRMFGSAVRQVLPFRARDESALTPQRFDELLGQPIEQRDSAWPMRFGDPSIFAIRYGEIDGATPETQASGVASKAFYNQVDDQGQPIHIGQSRPDRPETPWVGPQRTRYHAQVTRDFPRQYNATVMSRTGRPIPIAHTSDNFHVDVTDALLTSATCEFLMEQADSGRTEVPWSKRLVRQRIAKALHTRCQTFDADMLGELFGRTVQAHGTDLQFTNTHSAHEYEVKGQTLFMRSYHVFYTKLLHPGPADAAHSLKLVRREASMDLKTGTLSDEHCFVSGDQALQPRAIWKGRPVGRFIAEFGDAGEVAFETRSDGTPDADVPYFRPKDLVRPQV